MANYIAVPTKHVPDYLICHAVVPAGQTLHVGSVVALESIANARNYSVWTMTAPAANAKHVGIIVGAGIEELSDFIVDGNKKDTWKIIADIIAKCEEVQI